MTATRNLDRALRKVNDAVRLPHVPRPYAGRSYVATWVDPAGVAPPLKVAFGSVESFTRRNVAKAVTDYLAANPDLARYRPTIAVPIVNGIARQLWAQARRWEQHHADRVTRDTRQRDRKAAATDAATRALGAADR